MSDTWKSLRRKNRKQFEAIEREEKELRRLLWYVFPAIPAVFILGFSEQARVDLVQQFEWLAATREFVGPIVIAYLVIILYFCLIGVTQAFFYTELGPVLRIAVAWLAWAWFYYSTLVLDDLRLAFLVLAVISVFLVRIVWFLMFCYGRIRDGMFLRGPRDP